MRRTNSVLPAFVLFTLILQAGVSPAVLQTGTPGLEARGRVDLDGFGPQVPLSDQADNELVAPFTRSVVGVADAFPSLFSYASSADIGTLALRVEGSLTNSSLSQYFGGGVPVMSVVSQAVDVLTLTSSVAGSFDVTMQLVVQGSLVPSSQSGYVSANSLLKFGTGLNNSDSARYVDSTIDDTLSVTRTVSFAASGATTPIDVDALLSFTVTGVLPGETVSGDLGNSAFLNLILPPEVQLTGSQSGTYGVPIPIPEPQTYVLMLAGFALVGCWVHRRGRSSPPAFMRARAPG